MEANKETTANASQTTASALASASGFGWETVAIFLLFACYGATSTPGENEAHYLAKAKHYWNPAWCPHDHFLQSADAHAVFYWTFGWLTRFLPLAVTAWVGRVLTWGLLAWAWRRLSLTISLRPGLAILSAALFAFFVRDFHMAGEWVLGGVEAKGFAYVLVILAIEALLCNRWTAAWLLLGAATSFHVLVGGWSLVASVMAWLACGDRRPPLRRMVASLAGAAVLALPGLWPALAMGRGVAPEIMADANAIHVYQRLPHHLLFHRFAYAHEVPLFYVLRHLLLLSAWLTLGFLTPCTTTCGTRWQRPVRGFVGGAVAIAFAGAVLDQALLYFPDLAASLLKYYWFRMSDSLLPLGVAIAWIGAIERWWIEFPHTSRRLTGMAVVVAVVGFGMMAMEKRTELSPAFPSVVPSSLKLTPQREAQAARDWIAACRWLKENSRPDAICLTPRWQQSFKWYAERAEVVNWKDVPQDAPSVVEWWKRLGDAVPPEVSAGGVAALSDERLRELATQYGASYAVFDRLLGDRPTTFACVYPENADDKVSFAIYLLVDR